jgi:2-hydroxychromene-2-carboxylate isomerase
MSRRPVLEFWYDFASTYSYLTAMRIEQVAEKAGVTLRWRPFLLGPIFSAQGWTTSPFNLFPAKGRYMWKDMVRETAHYGLPLVKPEPFPQNSLIATRVALFGIEAGWCPDFSRAVFHAQFGSGHSISDQTLLSDILSDLGLNAGAILKDAQSETNKARLKVVTEEARSRGIFGAPSLLAEDGELFWGNDRLDQAIAWVAGDDT